MTTDPANVRKTDHPAARDWLAEARLRIGGPRALMVLAVLAVIAGAVLNWSWLVAAGVAPILLSALPCLVMCGLGLCMNRLIGGSCETSSLPSRENSGPQTTICAHHGTGTDRNPVESAKTQ
jgi:hypothetical protein